MNLQMTFRTAALTGLLAGVLLGRAVVPARADEARPTTPPAAVAPITRESLPTLLENMGYEAKKLDDTRYQLVVKAGGSPVTFTIGLSGDGSRVWLTAWLTGAIDSSKVPAETLVRLLAANNEFGPTHFAFVAGPSESEKYLTLSTPLDNRGLRPADIRSNIEIFCQRVNGTETLWRAIGTAGAPAAAR